jgi:hypothetical protein
MDRQTSTKKSKYILPLQNKNKATPHHAEGLVDPKVLAKKPVTDFEYPRACRFRNNKK